jgi:hypothetical protein
MSTGQETPIQESVNVISIVAILIGVGSYIAALNGTPVISPFLYWIAQVVYGFFPILNSMRQPSLPMVVSALACGGIFWIVMLPFAGLLAKAFNANQISNLERQTARLKRNRARIQKERRDKDGFDVT